MQVLRNKLILQLILSSTFILGGIVASADQKELNEIMEEIKKCPKSPNCISTLTTSEKHKVEPWIVKTDDVLKKIKAAALLEPRSKLISESEHHLQFTFKSKIFRFVDDAWFAINDGRVEYKSAARTGYRDFDKNKERAERIKKASGL